MKFLFLAAFCLAPLSSRADVIRPESTEGRLLVHKLAARASNAFIAQTDTGHADAGACEAAKGDLIQQIDQLELKNSEDLASARAALEKDPCNEAGNGLFAVTIYLRSADALN